jgi:hypothetical protein
LPPCGVARRRDMFNIARSRALPAAKLIGFT